jgi:hypothetical protein
VGRLARPGASILVLPTAGREELLAFLRTAYRVTGPARHVSLEDFLDGSTHLYHHFFLLRGRDLGGRAQETLPRTAFAPGQVTYRGNDSRRILAGLDRQPELLRDMATAGEVRYTWIDLARGFTRATVLVRSGEVRLSAETREDLDEGCRFLETCLRGLIQPGGEPAHEAAGPSTDEAARPGSGVPGQAFCHRFLEGWANTPSPLLDDRTPSQAVRSHAGRQQVAALLLGLERDMARLKRLGRFSADTSGLREQLNLPPGLPTPRRVRR